MRLSRTIRGKRSGAVAPLTAILLIPLLGMMAFAIDVGYMVVAQTELQNAADSAAMAGVQMLMNPYTQWCYPNQNSSAQSLIISTGTSTAAQTAKTYAAYNRAGGVNIQLQDSDLVFGFTDSQGNFNPHPGPSVFPNTIQVTARRDSTGGNQSNGALALFFGPLLGTPTVSLTATARATIYTGQITGFNYNVAASGLLLPVAVDINDWNQFFQNGTGADVNNASPNGLPQLNVYPGGGGQPGNNGLLSLMGSKAPSQQYYSGTTGWIQAGPSAGVNGDIAGLYSAGDLPLGPNESNWGAGPGMKSSLLGDFQAVENVPKLLPLYDTSGGNGSNAWYHIVEFVGVTLTYADGHGKANMTIDVQPNPTVDPTALISNPVPAGAGPAGSTPSFTFLAPKLTQ